MIAGMLESQLTYMCVHAHPGGIAKQTEQVFSNMKGKRFPY